MGSVADHIVGVLLIGSGIEVVGAYAKRLSARMADDLSARDATVGKEVGVAMGLIGFPAGRELSVVPIGTGALPNPAAIGFFDGAPESQGGKEGECFCIREEGKMSRVYTEKGSARWDNTNVPIETNLWGIGMERSIELSKEGDLTLLMPAGLT